jgi:transposase-like protein
MKTTGKCPKCDSDNVFIVPGRQDETSIMVDWGGFFTSAAVARYVCGKCGYVESFVDSLEDLDRIRRKYKRYAPETPQAEQETP